MRRFVLWLIKTFNVDVETVRYVPSRTIVQKVYVLKTDKYDHDLLVEGNLTVEGDLTVKGVLSCKKITNKITRCH